MEVTVNRNKVIVSDQEIEMIEMFSNGKPASEVARELKVVPRTIEGYLAKLRFEFACRNTTQLVATFLRKNLIK